MKYRDFGTQNWKVSALGFGCTQLPLQDGESDIAKVDEAAAIGLIRHAIDCGINYIDTAYTYHGGQSEVVVGKALRDGYRERVRLATKLPAWILDRPEDFDRFLGGQLGRLQTDFVDCFLFQALNGTDWRETVLRYGLLEKAAAALRDGRIRHLGFSFHGRLSEFEEILSGSDLWSLCQFQYNYANPQAQALIRLAADCGLAVVAMGALLGGAIADPPLEVRQLIEEFPLHRTPSEWALHWLWDQPEISTVLSSVQSVPQFDGQFHVARQSRIHCFGTKDQVLIGDLRGAYKARSAIPCTYCGDCMPCPSGLDVPANLTLVNQAKVFASAVSARIEYINAFDPRLRADRCSFCGVCEEHCPEKIAICDWIAQANTLFT
jgi:predicted aldo/keto reductase-like oxidoreductase